MSISQVRARALWLSAQRLDSPEPFGRGPLATKRAIEHLGYVQIDTIHVIERSHHHILATRIPSYARAHLRQAQLLDRSVFEYWTHALSYVPMRDYRFFQSAMKIRRGPRRPWFESVTDANITRVLQLIKKEGPLSIRDFDQDVRVDKAHEWSSRKPSKLALELAFLQGRLVISERKGMVKTYELAERHLGPESRQKAASDAQVVRYKLERALRAQGLVSLDSICHLDAKAKPAMKALIEREVRSKNLLPVHLEGADKVQHWVRREALDALSSREHETVHLLSPFDPLAIQRKRMKLFFDHDHRFEAYVPEAKRVFGYFALPVLVDDHIVALLDIKADREKKKLRMQKWTWLRGEKSAERKRRIEEALTRFSTFQFAST